MIMGGAGLGLMVAASLLIKNPERGVFETAVKEKKVEGNTKKGKPNGIRAMIDCLNEVNESPICRNIFTAGFLRAFGNVILTAFMPVYF